MRQIRGSVAAVFATIALLSMLAGPATAADGTVTIASLAFDPGTVTVDVGDSVTWSNQDQIAHTASGGSFDTGVIGASGQATVTFDAAGTFAYVCAIHPEMQGTVIVEAAAPAPTPTPPPAGGGSGGSGSGGGAATPPATDTIDQSEPPPATDVVAIALAVIGLVMLGGTAIVSRGSGRR